jgi:ribosomal protein L33
VIVIGRQAIKQTTLQCSECSNKLQIFRKSAKQRKKGHTKHMWCPYCQKVVGFTEIKDFEFDNKGWVSLNDKIELKV